MRGDFFAIFIVVTLVPVFLAACGAPDARSASGELAAVTAPAGLPTPNLIPNARVEIPESSPPDIRRFSPECNAINAGLPTAIQAVVCPALPPPAGEGEGAVILRAKPEGSPDSGEILRFAQDDKREGAGEREDGDLLMRDRGTSYLGYLKLMFHDEPGFEAGVRWNGDAFTAIAREVDLSCIHAALDPDGIPTSPLLVNSPIEKGGRGVTPPVRSIPIARAITQFTPDQIDEAYQYMKTHAVRGAYNWNGLYHVYIADEPAALRLAAALRRCAGVRAAWPARRMIPTGTVGPTPDFTAQQGYLYPYDTHGGLNVTTAWATPYGLTGAGVEVWDLDADSMWTHEDLNKIIQSETPPGTGYHMMAVAGVIIGQHNGFGVSGVSPAVYFTGTSTDPGGFAIGVAGDLLHPADEADISGPTEGNIYLGEVGWPGPPYGLYPESHFPLEADLDFFLGFQQLTSLGVHVVDAVGNSGLPLMPDHPVIKPVIAAYPYFLTEDSGAIWVGSSLSASQAKNPWSNCGPRIDVHAWGKGVVTTGKGDLFPGTDLAALDNTDRWYTATFANTSAAAAQIAGVVALLQEQVRRTMCPTPPLGAPGKLRCWLPPEQMRALLKASGEGHEANTLTIIDPNDATGYPDVPTLPAPDCPIGVQPDVGVALELLAEPGAYLPKINLRPKNTEVVAGHRLDLDADGRADLISWSRNHVWRVDLSGTQPSGGSPDGYGAWDLEFQVDLPLLDPPAGDVPPFNKGGSGGIFFPVVHDYNSDGRADLALYDSLSGVWRVRLTDQALLDNTWTDWDLVLDYSTQPGWQPRSRPLVGDFNGDHWLDTALLTPDGHWLIDDGGWVVSWNGPGEALLYDHTFGTFDHDVQYLTAAQLNAAPAWACGGATEHYPDFIIDAAPADLHIKIPDGLPHAGQIVDCSSDGVCDEDFGENDDVWGGFAHRYVPILAGSAKAPDGAWSLGIFSGDFPPATGFGDERCYPVVADFDGGGGDNDRAVLCPNGEWRIAPTSTASGKGITLPVDPITQLRVVVLGGDTTALPGMVFAGGVDYEVADALYGKYNFGCPKTAVCTIDDLPPPIGPYWAECLQFWSLSPMACLDY